LVGQIISVANVQLLVNPNEIADPEQTFLSKELRGRVDSELFDWRFTVECKQSQRFFIGQLPVHRDVEKYSEAAGSKPQPLALNTEVGQRSRFLVFLDFVHRFSFRSVNSNIDHIY
jgi:hypothetical protein